MNMNYLLPLLVLGQGKNPAGAVEAMLTSSNQIPEAPRTLLAVTQAIDQADRQAQQQKAVAKREEELATLIGDGKLILPKGENLSNDSRMLFMLSKLSDITLIDNVGRKLTNNTEPTGDGHNVKRLPTGKS